MADVFKIKVKELNKKFEVYLELSVNTRILSEAAKQATSNGKMSDRINLHFPDLAEDDLHASEIMVWQERNKQSIEKSNVSLQISEIEQEIKNLIPIAAIADLLSLSDSDVHPQQYKLEASAVKRISELVDGVKHEGKWQIAEAVGNRTVFWLGYFGSKYSGGSANTRYIGTDYDIGEENAEQMAVLYIDLLGKLRPFSEATLNDIVSHTNNEELKEHAEEALR